MMELQQYYMPAGASSLRCKTCLSAHGQLTNALLPYRIMIDYSLQHNMVASLSTREPEMFELQQSPTRLDEATNSVVAGTDRVKLFKGAEQALLELSTQERFSDTRVAVASSTSRKESAMACLRLFQV